MTSLFIVQSLSRVQLFATPWTAAHQGSLSITHSWSLFKLMSIESVMPSNHLILCYLLLLPSIFSSIRVFSNKSALRIRWLKYWSFSFSISSSTEYSGLISPQRPRNAFQEYLENTWRNILCMSLGRDMATLNKNLEGNNSSQSNAWVQFWGNGGKSSYHFLRSTFCQTVN